MIVREPVFAGTLYPGTRDECLKAMRSMLAHGWSIRSESRRLYGGIVPSRHWRECGASAAGVYRVLAGGLVPKVLVLLGGIGKGGRDSAALFGSGRWETPVGSLRVDERLAERLLGQSNLFVDDPYAHETESAIEVQLPFIKHLFGAATILPILVPGAEEAPDIGEAIARTIESYGYNAVVIGCQDVTGDPNAGAPGHGAPSAPDQTWAGARGGRIEALVRNMQAREIVAEGRADSGSYGLGAVAAAVRAAVALGATEGVPTAYAESIEPIERSRPFEAGAVCSPGFVFV